MADTNTKTPEPSELKKHYDYVNSLVDEQTILDKYNAATMAQYAAQREQNRQAENQFYNQMYNTQNTAMDTIRKANAAAVSTGASRGVQAANELSAILGLQNESIASATELAQANRQTAQEETAAVLENVLNAYQTAQQERANLLQSSIEAASVEQTRQTAEQQTEQQAKATRDEYLRNLHASDPAAYYRELAKDNAATDFVNMTDEQFTTNQANAYQAIDEISDELKYNWNDFADWDWGESGSSKGEKIKTKLRNIYAAYGLTEKQADDTIKNLNNTMSNYNRKQLGDRSDPALKQAAVNYLQSQFNLQYAAQRVASKTTKQ